MVDVVGCVSAIRYEQIVEAATELVEGQTRAQFQIGDWALEIEPIQLRGGHHSVSALAPTGAVLHRFAETIGVPFKTLETYRYVSSRWPRDTRVPHVSHYVHRILASREDRVAVIANPPDNPFSGDRRWSPDSAARMVGWAPRTPVTPQERVNRVHDLVRDDETATRVVTDLLHRPDVAFRVMSDQTARHEVNRAQLDHATQTQIAARERTRSIDTLQHTTGVLDLLAAADAFVAAIGRAIPLLGNTHPNDPDLNAMRDRLSKVRTAADWAETQLEHLDSIDTALAKLLHEATP